MKPVIKMLVYGICLIVLFGVFAPAGAHAVARKSGTKSAHAISHKKHRRHPNGTNNMEKERISYTFQKITVKNVKGSKTATDDWVAGGSQPAHHHKK